MMLEDCCQQQSPANQPVRRYTSQNHPSEHFLDGSDGLG